jgi:hypothetical protein
MVLPNEEGCIMTDLCTHCGEPLAGAAIFCARCGGRVMRHEALPEHPAAEKIPVRGAFSGLYFGLIAPPLMLIVGIMLCLTGWGIVFGLPGSGGLTPTTSRCGRWCAELDGQA